MTIAVPQQADSFETNAFVTAVDSSRDSSVSSGADGANISGLGVAELPQTPPGSDDSDSQMSARELSDDRGFWHQSTTSPSEHSPPSDGYTPGDSRPAPSNTISTFKSARPPNDSQDIPDRLLATTDVVSINAEIKSIEDKIAEATEVRNQENSKITALSSAAAASEHQINSRKTGVKDLYMERRELQAKIKDIKQGIDDSTIELGIKNRDVNPHVVARDKAQDSINQLADQKRKQEKKLKTAQYNEMLQQSIPDPVLRDIGKKLRYGRDTFDVPSDIDSSGDSDSETEGSTNSEDEYDSESDASEGTQSVSSEGASRTLLRLIA